MNKKYHVFFRRVSSSNQDLETQIEFDRPYREKCDEDKVLIFNEDATSANKLRVDQRPKIMEVLELIKANKVDTLYAYDRTRLFRDYYEGQEFIHLCAHHSVKIIFTSSSNGHIPFTGDVFLEGILNLFSDVEGKNITRRTAEARRKYPPKKFGYEKTKNKQYRKLVETEPIIEHFFEDLKHVKSRDNLILFLKKYRQALGKGRTDENLLKMATDPFYAGYDLFDRQDPLLHVDPFLSLETFLEIQEQLSPLIESYEKYTKELLSLYVDSPKCGLCHKALKPKLNSDRSISYVSCSSGHKKIIYTTQEINAAVTVTIKQVLDHFNVEKLLSDSNMKMKSIKKTVEEEKEKTQKLLKQASDHILFSEVDSYNHKWQEHEQYKKIQQLHSLYNDLEIELNKKNAILIENRKLYKLIKGEINNQEAMNIGALASLFIHEIRLLPEKIEIDVGKFDYVNDFDTEIILFQGDIA